MPLGGGEVGGRDEHVPAVALEQRAAAVGTDGVCDERADGVPRHTGDDGTPVGPRRAGERLGQAKGRHERSDLHAVDEVGLDALLG